jgi:hypothetical protein
MCSLTASRPGEQEGRTMSKVAAASTFLIRAFCGAQGARPFFLKSIGSNAVPESVLDAESAGWNGLSQAFGLAGYVNLDVVRNPTLSSEPYLARLWLRKVIPLSDETVEVERNPLSLLTTLPVRRIDIHVGKMSLPDFFDVNSVASDSHMQFLNWTLDNNGAWAPPIREAIPMLL